MDRLVALAVSRRYLMVGLFAVVMIGGVIAFKQLNIEAYPDPTPPMVDIVTQSPGLSSEEIERYITIPIETQVAGIKNLRTIRTISLYGLSDVKLQFSFDYTYDEALQQVLNRLSQLAPLPGNVQPGISPLSPIGEIYRYRLAGPPNYSALDLKTLQDWILQRRFRAVPGVIDVTGWGGKTKTYELQVDFNKLIAYGITLPQLLQTLGNSNINVGGNTVNIGSQAAVVRGVGLIRSIEDLRNTMLTQSGGNPVLVKDVASVMVGNQPRLGIAGQDETDDIVQGIVLMRRGEQSMPTIERVHQEVQRINSAGILPPGVQIERIYDRKELIDITTRTVLHNMVFGIVLIFLLQWVFIGNLRSAIIVGATIPFALAFAVGILVIRGESANLLSVGAIDFGLIVDATVIMVETIFRRLAQPPAQRHTEPLAGERSSYTLSGKVLEIFNAAAAVNRSIFFAAGIIIAAFIPLFTLSGVEGHIFGPMAKTYAYALAGGLGRGHAAAACRRDGAFPRARVPAQARGRQPVDPRHHAGDHLARGGQQLRQRDPHPHPRVPRGRLRGVAARPSRRRHRRGRLLQCRILRAAQAGVAVARGSDQGRSHDRPSRQAAGALPRHRVQFLAISAGQCRRGGVRRQRRELDQAVRQ